MSGFDSSEEEDDVATDTSPLSIDWLDLAHEGCTAQLGISGLPGCRFKETRRNLRTDINKITSLEVQDVFVLCTRGELKKFRVPDLLQEYGFAGLAVHHSPFPDGEIPPLGMFMKMLDDIRVNLMQGRRTLVHCYGGLGRSAVVCACLLLLLDATKEPDDVIDILRNLRGPGAVQSVKQYNFIQEFREKMAEYETARECVSRSVSR